MTRTPTDLSTDAGLEGMREKIAFAIGEETTLNTHIVRSRRLRMADRILAIPEIAQALHNAYGNSEFRRYLGGLAARTALGTVGGE
jgi:hypothetical protein